MNHGKVKIGEEHLDIVSKERVYSDMRECTVQAENDRMVWHRTFVWGRTQKELIVKRDAAVKQIKSDALAMQSRPMLY